MLGVGGLGEDVLRAIEERSGAVIEAVRGRVAEMGSLYARSVEELRRSVDEGAAQAVTGLVSANDMLKNELGAVLARLEGANRSLQQISTEAGGNLGAIEDGLAGRVHQLQLLMSDVTTETGRAADQLGSQVDTLRDMSSGALREIVALAGTLDERGRELAETSRTSVAALTGATAELGRAEDRIGQTLDERRARIATLLDEVDARSDAVTDATRSLASHITRALGEAEARTRDLGATLAEGAENATGTLRASLEQITSEMSGRLNTALSQVREAAGEFKGMSGTIRHELDRTREELKRGLTSLPQETEETTAEMRRVVADQIKALNELSQLVSRSPRALDVVPAAAVGGSRRGETAVVAEARPSEPAERRSSGRKHDLPEEPTRASRDRPRRSDEVKATAAQRGLDTAAEDDEAEGPLDTIARDVARLIDGPRGIEMWERYRRGEKGAFTRRLYTAQGLGTFDDVRRNTGDRSFSRRSTITLQSSRS